MSERTDQINDACDVLGVNPGTLAAALRPYIAKKYEDEVRRFADGNGNMHTDEIDQLRSVMNSLESALQYRGLRSVSVAT